MTKQEEIREVLEGIESGGLSVDEGIRELDIIGVVIKYEKDDVGCGCKLCLEGTGLSKEIVEPLIEL